MAKEGTRTLLRTWRRLEARRLDDRGVQGSLSPTKAEHGESRLWLVRQEMPDGNAFVNQTALDCDCVVGVDLNDWKGAETDEFKLVLVTVILDEDLLTDGEFMTGTVMIGLEQTCIDFGLTVSR